jgi:anti-sigma B factor antagonist
MGVSDDLVATVTAHRQGEAAVLEVAGEIDMLTAPRLDDAVRRMLGDGPRLLVIDLLMVSFFGSSGLTTLIEAQQLAGERTSMRVVADGAVVLRPLQLTGLDQQFAVYSTREVALTAAPAPRG